MKVNPLAKAVFAFIEKVYKHSKQQSECDTIISDIVDCITNILPSIQSAKKHAPNRHLQVIIPKMLDLIGNASNFIEEYNLDSAAVHALHALSSSKARDQIDKFTKEFTVFKDCFDRAVQCHILDVEVETRQYITTHFEVIQRALETRGNAIYGPDCHKVVLMLFKRGAGGRSVARGHYNLSSPAWPSGQLRKMTDWSSFILAASGDATGNE
ncbi:hypothetical protein BD410DRAFT_611683 [Rickenella mellea]|uniref:Uncharacterized protein n=1 Tax=Rickenella mellea TaxID=50990 RepID=A0A4Y7PP27_9AGAM|nr:hypothetical protein BD410DRAFT_611683 [Rickenella mellea]